MNTIIKAINYAALAHKDQRRKDANKTPYINHPIEVMLILSENGVNDIDTLCAAVLHDTIEDTKTTYEYICDNFGHNVAKLVMECTDDKSLSKVNRKKLQIEHGRDISVSGKLIKLADKLSNLSGLFTNPPISWTQEYINGYIYWSISVFSSIRGYNNLMDNKFIKLMNDNNFDVDLDKIILDEYVNNYNNYIENN